MECGPRDGARRLVAAVPTEPASSAAGVASPAHEEAEVIARARCGDRSAQGALYWRHYPTVRRHVQHLLGPDPDVDDVVQDVFVSVFASLRGFRGESSLKTWLHRVTVRVARRYWRRRAVRRALGVAWATAAPASGATVPGPDSDAREQLRLLYEALGRISPRLREAFVLRCVEGLSVEAAARVAGVRPDAMKQRARRAVCQLQDILSETTGQEAEDV